MKYITLDNWKYAIFEGYGIPPEDVAEILSIFDDVIKMSNEELSRVLIKRIEVKKEEWKYDPGLRDGLSEAQDIIRNL